MLKEDSYIGKRFANFVVVGLDRVERKQGSRSTYFLCKCDCGQEIRRLSYRVKNGECQCTCQKGARVKLPKVKETPQKVEALADWEKPYTPKTTIVEEVKEARYNRIRRVFTAANGWVMVF